MTPGMSFTMAPTVNMDVQLIDFLDLERYLEMSLPLPATGKERRALIQRVKDTVYELRSDKSIRRDKDRLKTYFVSSYCFLNFATPEVRVLAELADTREDFLKTMARKPFYMIENGRPTALNLYHKE